MIHPILGRPFIPYYINKNRLIDLHTMIVGGYSEYEEVDTESTKDKQFEANGSLHATGKVATLVNIGGELKGNFTNSVKTYNHTSSKRFHTITSILYSLIEAMHKNGSLLYDESLFHKKLIDSIDEDDKGKKQLFNRRRIPLNKLSLHDFAIINTKFYDYNICNYPLEASMN